MADRTADRSRPAWLPLVGAAVVVPTVLAGLTQLWPRPQVEDQLTRTGGEALAAAGFPGAGLVLDGRDATISGIDPADSQRAIDVGAGRDRDPGRDACRKPVRGTGGGPTAGSAPAVATRRSASPGAARTSCSPAWSARPRSAPG